MGYRETICEVALREVGNKETGKDVIKYNAEMWGKQGLPWCATFVAWCARQAGVPLSNIMYTASASGSAEWMRAHGKFRLSASRSLLYYTPLAGDVIYFTYKGGPISHAGIVIGTEASTIYTVEGNYSNSVKRAKYEKSNVHIVGFGVLDGSGTNYNNTGTDGVSSYGEGQTGFIGNSYAQPINITINAPTYLHNYGTLKGTDIYYRNLEPTPVIGTTTVERKVKDEVTGQVNIQKEEVEIFEYKLPPDHVPETENWGSIPLPALDDINLDLKLFTVDKTELISGIKLNADGSYIKADLLDVNKILKDFLHYQQIVDMIHNSQLEVQNDNAKDIIEHNKAGAISAVVNAKNAFDRLGRTIKQGSRCRICGKQIAYLPADGYCSVECFIKDLSLRVLTLRVWSEDDPVNVIVDYLLHWVLYINMIINLITDLPVLLRNVRWIPDVYRNFVIIRLNMCFLKLRLAVTRLLKYKNDAIIKLLKPVANGVFSDEIAKKFALINTLINIINTVTKALNTALAAAIKVMQDPTSTISAESYAWLMTPRSAMNRNAGKLFIEIPMATVSQGIIKLIPSGLLNDNILAMDKWILKNFPPITNAEYLLDPDAFNLRLVVSDQSDMVHRAYDAVAGLLVCGPDYMPRYKNLKLTNYYFIMAILETWAVQGLSCFGSIIHPDV